MFDDILNGNVVDNSTSSVTDVIGKLLGDIFGKIKISPTIENPTVNLSDNPYVKYGAILIIILAIYWFVKHG